MDRFGWFTVMHQSEWWVTAAGFEDYCRHGDVSRLGSSARRVVDMATDHLLRVEAHLTSRASNPVWCALASRGVDEWPVADDDIALAEQTDGSRWVALCARFPLARAIAGELAGRDDGWGWPFDEMRVWLDRVALQIPPGRGVDPQVVARVRGAVGDGALGVAWSLVGKVASVTSAQDPMTVLLRDGQHPRHVVDALTALDIELVPSPGG